MTGPFKPRLFRALLFFAIILFAAGLLLYSKETSAAAAEGLTLCGRVLVPSLLPFFVVSSMAIDSGLAQSGGALFRRPMALLFRLPGACAPAFILGLIGGYPVGAAAAIKIYQSGLCSKTQAERLLAFCNNCGPAFILGAVGASLFGGTYAGLLLYGSHILASLTVGFLFRFYRREGGSLRPYAQLSHERPPFTKLFIGSVKSSLPSMLNICAYVIFFSVAVRLLYLFGVIPALARVLWGVLRPLGLSMTYAEKLVGGFFEVTTGVYGIVLSGAKMSAQLAAAAFMLGWAGLSVHCQVLDFIGDSGLSPWPYILGKLLHGGFSALFVWIGTRLIPFDTQVSKAVSGYISAFGEASPFFVFAVALFCVCIAWALLLLCLRLRK